MTRNPSNSEAQPTLEDLMVRFLASRSDAAAAAVESGEGEVELYEVAAGFRVDPRSAWADATLKIAAPGQTPPDWTSIVNQPATAFAVPMAAGNFPQRVRDLHPLLVKFNPNELRPSGTSVSPVAFSGLRGWIVKHSASHPVLCAGLLRLLGEYTEAEKLLPESEANERAALLWQQGKCEGALGQWSAMEASPAVVFNRGMALLFLGRYPEARSTLTDAVAQLPESSGWNALARLYLAIAEIQN